MARNRVCEYFAALTRQKRGGEHVPGTLADASDAPDPAPGPADFAESRDMARQLVRHGHIRVNGRKVDIPSYHVGANDIVEVAEKSRTMLPFEIAQAKAGERPVLAWLEVISSQLRVLVHSIPARQVIDTPVQEQLIVELYSK